MGVCSHQCSVCLVSILRPGYSPLPSCYSAPIGQPGGLTQPAGQPSLAKPSPVLGPMPITPGRTGLVWVGAVCA